MLAEPSIACRVLRPFARPIVARPPELLVVWPGHPELTLVTYDASGQTPLRWTHWPEGHLYGDLLHLFLDAKIACLSVESERALLGIAS
jgi:hypothetical protein